MARGLERANEVVPAPIRHSSEPLHEMHAAHESRCWWTGAAAQRRQMKPYIWQRPPPKRRQALRPAPSRVRHRPLPGLPAHCSALLSQPSTVAPQLSLPALPAASLPSPPYSTQPRPPVRVLRDQQQPGEWDHLSHRDLRPQGRANSKLSTPGQTAASVLSGVGPAETRCGACQRPEGGCALPGHLLPPSHVTWSRRQGPSSRLASFIELEGPVRFTARTAHPRSHR